MIYLMLFYEFFIIGLFAIGGGMATIPFLQSLGERTGWYDAQLISDMIAISESTPGPIGINMATYVGYNVAGVFGGVVATLGEILPSIIIVVIFSKTLLKKRNNVIVDDAFYALRAAVTGLIAAAAIDIFSSSILNVALYEATKVLTDLLSPIKIVLFIAVFIAIKKFKKHPILYIAVCACIGVGFKL